jgi:hypothetical protein
MKSSLKKSTNFNIPNQEIKQKTLSSNSERSSYQNDNNEEDSIINNTHNMNFSSINPLKTYYYKGYQMELVSDYIKELENINEIIIEQKLEFKEILTCCSNQGRYNVYYINEKKEKKYLFQYKEESSCCCRNCCPNSLKSFKLNMFHMLTSNKKKDLDYKKLIAVYERPFECTFLCCNRPIIYETRLKNREMKQFDKGFILDECGYAISYIVYNQDKILRWKIYTNYCQYGVCCNCTSIGKCFEIDFWIFDGRANVKIDKPEGNIRKIFKGSNDFDFDCDCFIITFPKVANPRDKIDLITATIMIDYRYFEGINCFPVEIV